MLRVFLANPSCKHILFAGCHDNGYLPNLETYKHDEAVSSRITLVESTPAQPGYSNLNMKTIRLDSVFRTTPLPDRVIMAPPPPISPASSAQPSPAPVPPPAARAPVITLPVLTKSSTPPEESTWASVGKSGNTETRISIASNKKSQRYIIFNS